MIRELAAHLVAKRTRRAKFKYSEEHIMFRTIALVFALTLVVWAKPVETTLTIPGMT